MNEIINEIIKNNFNNTIFKFKIIELSIYQLSKNFINYIKKKNFKNINDCDNIFNFGILILLISYFINLLY